MKITSKKPQQILDESAEKLKEKSGEVVKQTFTELKQDVIKQLFDRDSSEKPGERKNFTPFDESVREKMGENFMQQESPELERIRQELAGPNQPDALKEQLANKQLQHLREEERRARELLDKEEEERKQQELEEEQQKQAEEQQRLQESSAGMEPTGKQARGSLFARKKKQAPTIENKPSQGKQ